MPIATDRSRRLLDAPPLVLSDRQAAQLLRIDRATTLQELKRRGLLDVVPWGSKRNRITLESVQALARRGWTESDGQPGRAVSRRRARPVPGVGGRIRDLEVDP